MAEPPMGAGEPFRGSSELLDNRYRLESLLGRGGMGAVYRAVDLRLGRAVAIKVVHGTLGEESRRFFSEARTLANFSHPNLVRVLDAGTTDGQPFLVMELVDGPTLAKRCAAGPLPLTETAGIAAGVLAALSYVHGQGVVHRDVKPANVLLDATGTAHLADFGIARIVDATPLTVVGVTLGTPAYLAPEQVEGAAVGTPADVYALGLVLLECLSGERPFAGTPVEMASARLHRGPAIPEHLPVLWRQLIGDMTARRPEERPSALEVLSRLAASDPFATQGLIAGVPGGGVGDEVAPTRDLGIAAVGVGAVGAAILGAAAPSGALDGDTSALTVPEPKGRAPRRGLVSRRRFGVLIGCAVLAVALGLSLASLGGGGAHPHPGGPHLTGATNTSSPATTTTSSTTTTTSSTTTTTTLVVDTTPPDQNPPTKGPGGDHHHDGGNSGH